MTAGVAAFLFELANAFERLGLRLLAAWLLQAVRQFLQAVLEGYGKAREHRQFFRFALLGVAVQLDFLAVCAGLFLQPQSLAVRRLDGGMVLFLIELAGTAAPHHQIAVPCIALAYQNHISNQN